MRKDHILLDGREEKRGARIPERRTGVPESVQLMAVGGDVPILKKEIVQHRPPLECAIIELSGESLAKLPTVIGDGAAMLVRRDATVLHILTHALHALRAQKVCDRFIIFLPILHGFSRLGDHFGIILSRLG